MNTSLFLPKEIKVGYQEREDTYTEKLAYVIYIDEKGVVRKEKSFDGWRDRDLGTDQYENIPMSGFVLNKKAGGYDNGWNHRQTYVRVYDPRGFEFEISVENLLYILDNMSSIIGKGLEGEFVYAWDGTELVLLPVNAPEYEPLKSLNDLRHKKDYIKAKDLKVGNTYLTRDNRQLVYLGKFDKYSHSYDTCEPIKSSSKKFWFSSTTKTSDYKKYEIETLPSVSRRLIDVLEDFPHLNLSEMLEELENLPSYSPVDMSKTIIEPYTIESFLKRVPGGVNKSKYIPSFYITASNKEEFNIDINNNIPSFYGQREPHLNYYRRQNRYEGRAYEIKDFRDIFNVLKPIVIHYYQTNGKLYKTKGDF